MSTEFILLTLPAGEEIAGASLSEIVDTLIPQHRDVPEGPEGFALRLMMRELTLAEYAHRAQAAVVASLTENAPEAITGLSEDAVTAIYHDRNRDVIEMTEWDSDIPLFVMASGFVPYTALPRPSGASLVFLDAFNETTFIDAVKAAGCGELFIRELPDPGDDE